MPTVSATTTSATATGAAGPKKVMKRATSASPEAAAAAPAATPVAAEKVTKRTAPTPAQRAPSPTKSVASAGSTSQRAPSPAPVTAVAAVVAVVAPTPVTGLTIETSLTDEIATLQQQLTILRETATNALTALKRITKKAAQDIKEARKNRRRKTEVAEGETVVKKPSNFTIPIPISEEMAVFVAKATGEPKNTTSTRAQVSSAITKYINDNSLRTKHDVSPDATLKKLLSADSEGQNLTIFTIAKYTKHHFLKASA
jgi:hypothetical protein